VPAPTPALNDAPEVVSSMAGRAATPLGESLPRLVRYVVAPRSEAENEAFLAGPYGPGDTSAFVAEFVHALVAAQQTSTVSMSSSPP
jgi:hypothetical protein